MSNAPTVLFGLVPLIRAVVRTATTADQTTTVTADDSGTLFVSMDVGTTHTFTLPTLALGKGKCFIFFNGQTTSYMTITGPTDKVIGVDDATATSIISGANTGDAAIVVCDGTWYYAITTSGAKTTAGVWTTA